MKRQIAFVVSIVAIAIGFFGAGFAMAGTGNDRVLREDQYIEVFKKEGRDKNYTYTITEFKDVWDRVCTVTTGDSEQTIALDCDFMPRGNG